MKTYTLATWDIKDQFLLLKEMYTDYLAAKDVWAWRNFEVKTPSGVFENFGGFNGQPSDLWLRKKGTVGATVKTFWRTSFGSKRGGFRVHFGGFKTRRNIHTNMQAVADEIGAKINGFYFE